MTPMIELVSLLFEGVEDYTPNKFALITHQNEYYTGYILVDQEKYKQHVFYNQSVVSCIASYGYAGKAEGCSDATEISLIGSNKSFPKAGYAMYCCISKITNGPITSNRASSTSDSAKAAWRSIEQSSEWQEEKLDNYFYDRGAPVDNRRVYYDIHGSWPGRTFTKLPGPQTPTESDDCALRPLDDKLGSASAWRYVGSLDVDGLLRSGEELLSSVWKERRGLEVDRQAMLLNYAGERMALDRING